MQGFYDRLWTYIENLKGPGQEGGYFSKDDVKLESVETEDPSSSSALSAGPQALLVRLKGDRWIRIRIDVRSGRVVVHEVGKTGDFDDRTYIFSYLSLCRGRCSFDDRAVW